MEANNLPRLLFGIIAVKLLFASAQGAGALRWESIDVSVDAEFGQKEVNAHYAFTNASDSVVTITKTQASCGCTVPSLEKKTYAPRESGELHAHFDIGSRVGMQRKEITVGTEEGGGNHSYTLTLNVEIPQLIQLKSRALLWKVGEKPDPKDCEVIIHTQRPMKIDGVALKNGDPASSSFNFAIEEIEANHKYKLRITPKNTTAKVRETCYFTSSDDTEKRLKNFPIYAWIR